MTRLEREQQAKHHGHEADVAFRRVCNQLRIKVDVANYSPLSAVMIAEEEARREFAARICGND